jgi:hypothetical protein
MLRYVLPAVTVALLLVPAARAGDDAKAKKKNKGPDTSAVFDKLDGDKNAKLSPAEFANFQTELKKKKEGEQPKKAAKAGGKRATEIFTKLDADKNGSLSKDEFAKLTDVMKEMKKKDK